MFRLNQAVLPKKWLLIGALVDVFCDFTIDIICNLQRVWIHASQLLLKFVHELIFQRICISRVVNQMTLLFDLLVVCYSFKLKILLVPFREEIVDNLPSASLEIVVG